MFDEFVGRQFLIRGAGKFTLSREQADSGCLYEWPQVYRTAQIGKPAENNHLWGYLDDDGKLSPLEYCTGCGDLRIVERTT